MIERRLDDVGPVKSSGVGSPALTSLKAELWTHTERLVDVLDLDDCLGYDQRIESNKRQDQTRDMTTLVGTVSRTTKASPPAG